MFLHIPYIWSISNIITTLQLTLVILYAFPMDAILTSFNHFIKFIVYSCTIHISQNATKESETVNIWL